MQNFQQDVIGNSPQAKAADGEEENSRSNAEEQATLRATQATAGQDADFGAALVFFRAAWHSNTGRPPGFVPERPLGCLDKTPAATAVSSALVAIAAPAKRVMAAFIYRAENNLIARSKRLPAEGTLLAQEWGLFINKDGLDHEKGEG